MKFGPNTAEKCKKGEICPLKKRKKQDSIHNSIAELFNKIEDFENKKKLGK